MKRILKFMKKYRWKIFFIGFTCILLITGGILFKLLIKVKSVRYIYNYMVDTKGGLLEEYFPENEAGADSVTAQATIHTNPSKLGITPSLQKDGQAVERYERAEPIYFTQALLNHFTAVQGVITFRGDYVRNQQSYGDISLTEKKFDREYWSFTTGKVLKGNGVDYWSGNGWTGQPLVVEWDEETKQIMNLYEESKKKENLIEVIYPGMDGTIHFLDMETGEETRAPINVGMTFKGTASLHPDGIPMLVCGSGDAQTGVYGECISPRIYIYSLIDGSLLYEIGANDEFAPRVWHAFDSSPIFHGETDTLICPGENGVLYTLKLNTRYDKEAGTLSIKPSELVNFSFTRETYEQDHRYGSESSASVWGNYLFLGDNGGTCFCIDLNTMKMVWAQDVKEDINSSIIFEEDENKKKFIYLATTLKFNMNSHSIGEASIYKLNAMTGEVIWRKPYEVHTVSGLAGGILSTGVVGKGPINDLVIYSVSKTPDIEGGYLVALNKKTGAVVWEKRLTMYSWSSTGMLYTTDNQAYLVQGCQNGDLLLMDAKTGELLDKMNFASQIEATPAIFGDRLVVGMRNEKIIGVRMK